MVCIFKAVPAFASSKDSKGRQLRPVIVRDGEDERSTEIHSLSHTQQLIICAKGLRTSLSLSLSLCVCVCVSVCVCVCVCVPMQTKTIAKSLVTAQQLPNSLYECLKM